MYRIWVSTELRGGYSIHDGHSEFEAGGSQVGQGRVSWMGIRVADCRQLQHELNKIVVNTRQILTPEVENEGLTRNESKWDCSEHQ